MFKVTVLYGHPDDPAAFERHFDSEEEWRASSATPEGRATSENVSNYATGGATVLIAEVD